MEDRTLTLTLTVAQADALVNLIDAGCRVGVGGIQGARQVIELTQLISDANQASLQQAAEVK